MSSIRVHTNGMIVTYEWQTCRYGWHTSAYEWHTKLLDDVIQDITIFPWCTLNNSVNNQVKTKCQQEFNNILINLFSISFSQLPICCVLIFGKLISTMLRRQLKKFSPFKKKFCLFKVKQRWKDKISRVQDPAQVTRKNSFKSLFKSCEMFWR